MARRLTRQKIRHIILSQSDAQIAAFCLQIEDVDASYIMWLDETGVDCRDGIWRIGYSLRGHAPVSQKLMGRGKKFSALACMSVRGIEDVELFEGAVHGDKFCDYLGKLVLPSMLRLMVSIQDLSKSWTMHLSTMSTKCRK